MCACILYFISETNAFLYTLEYHILDDLNDKYLLTHRLKIKNQCKMSESVHSESCAGKSLWSEPLPSPGGLLEVVVIPWIMMGLCSHSHIQFPSMSLSISPFYEDTNYI